MPLAPTAGQIETALAGARAAVPVRFSWQRRTLLVRLTTGDGAAEKDITTTLAAILAPSFH